MTNEQAAALLKNLVPPGPSLIADSEKYREVLTGALVTLVTRAVAAERERNARVAQDIWVDARDTEWDEGVNYAKRLIAAAIRRGDP